MRAAERAGADPETGDGAAPHRPLRVVVVEDHELLRFGLERALEAATGIEVAGTTTAAEAVSMVRRVLADMVVVDIDAHDGAGDLLCQRLRSAEPRLRCVLLCDAMPMRRVIELWHSGISGFADRRAPAHRLTEICRQAGKGVMAVDPGVCGDRGPERAGETPGGATSLDPDGGRFSEREIELLICLAEGMNNREIAQQLMLAEKTVRNCLTRLFRKLDVVSRTQAAVMAVRLIGPIPVAIG